ncbi:MAG: TlpA disulfide reductase family protein [Bacteroidia bacterium]|nr:TlpA disulfide reductase family protein [Bacteroidia bacterium]
MKKFSLLLIAAIAMFSCQTNKTYKISGTVADPAYEGKNVYIQEMAANEMIPVDTAVVTNGAFTFEGQADSTVLRFIALDETVNPQKPSRVLTVLEPGNIDVRFDSTITVAGSKLNDDYNTFRKEEEKLSKDLRAVSQKYRELASAGLMTDSIDAELNAEFDEKSADLTTKTADFIKTNIQNPLGQFLFMTSAEMFKPETQKEILALTDDTYKSRENIQRIVKRLENAENVAIGKKFKDFTMKDPNGNDVSLSDYAGKGKVVLVDFWAAWCGPCVAEMPNVVAAYNNYKDKGFEVVGVSLDREKEQWLKGIKDMNMAWPQMSDLKFWETPVVELYAFRGIPHTVLLDGEGTIIAKDLRGAELHNKLNELLGN